MAAQQAQEEPSSPTEKRQLPTPPPELEEAAEKVEEAKSPSTNGSEAREVKLSEITGGDAEPTSKTKQVQSEGEGEKVSKAANEEAGKDGPAEDAKKEGEDKKSKDDASKTDDEDKKKDDEKKEEKKKALPRGMKAGVKDLWAKTDAQCKCCTTWVEENPDEGKNIEESDECLQHAIVVRRKKKHEGNRKPLKVDSIVVHSPLIKRVLQTVFTGYPDLVVDLDELIFDAPFAPFFFRWNIFAKAVEDEKDDMTRSHLKLLYDALEKELDKPIKRQEDLLRHKAIDFELLWTLYTPGTLMYSHDNGHDRLYETGDCEYWQDLSGMKFTVRCEMIDWDGEKFGKVTLSETINKFKGTRQITSLPSYPLKFHPKAEEMKKKCVERGRRFQELAGVNCKDYKGTAIEYTKYSIQTVTTKRHLEGRVMLDEELFSKFNPDESQSVRDLGEDAEEVKKSEAEAMTRLEEKVVQAKEALKKAEEEEKKREEEEKKNNEEKKKEEGKEKEEEKKPEEENEKKEENEKEKESPATADKKDDKVSGTKQCNSADTKLDELPSKTAEDEKSGTGSTDSEGAPTPPSEQAEDEQEAQTYSNDEKQELKDDQLAICSSWLRGYSLAHQKWASFSVEHISEVTWNDDAFQELTLPDEYRELILATIQSQIRQNQWKQKMEKVDKEQKPLSVFSKKGDAVDDLPEDDPAQFDDFIAQKGLGYIMLFSGNPGVGKTATAESIAELLHVPLCVISVGNLGTSAESVESALQDVLELASKWNAVLLLDEADIFLEQRTKHDLHRNAVVSVFLRLLEYYQGVLCLTTNRSEEIDVAFHSRIHISLPFPDLTENNREQIWRHFAKITNKKHESTVVKRKAITEKNAVSAVAPAASSETPVSDSDATTNGTKTTETPQPIQDEHHNSLIELSHSDFRKLSQTPLNGRQIKNAFKTAVLLASYKKEKVQLKHVKIALKTIDGNGLGKREIGRMYY